MEIVLKGEPSQAAEEIPTQRVADHLKTPGAGLLPGWEAFRKGLGSKKKEKVRGWSAKPLDRAAECGWK